MGVVKVLAKLDKLFILAKEPEKDTFNVVILTPEVVVQEFPETVSGSSIISLQCNQDELRKFYR